MSRYSVSCPGCGRVEVESNVPVPATDDEYDTALAVVITEHAIDAHLAEIGVTA